MSLPLESAADVTIYARLKIRYGPSMRYALWIVPFLIVLLLPAVTGRICKILGLRTFLALFGMATLAEALMYVSVGFSIYWISPAFPIESDSTTVIDSFWRIRGLCGFIVMVLSGLTAISSIATYFVVLKTAEYASRGDRLGGIIVTLSIVLMTSLVLLVWAAALMGNG